MEFERAIYRVYERCLDGFRDDMSDSGSKSCNIFQLVTLIGGIFFTIILALLHVEYVGSHGCLPSVLHELNLAHNINNMNINSSNYNNQRFDLGMEQLLGIDLIGDLSPKYLLNDDDDTFRDGDGDERRRMLNKKEIENEYTNEKQKEYIIKNNINNNYHNQPHRRSLFTTHNNININNNHKNKYHHIDYNHHDIVNNNLNNLRSNIDVQEVTRIDKSMKVNSFTSISDRPPLKKEIVLDTGVNHTYDYLFSVNRQLIFMDPIMRQQHGFKTVNITLDSTCFGSMFMRSIIPLGGIDVVMSNYLMYTYGAGNKGGLMKSATNDYYSWRANDLLSYYDFPSWFYSKLGIILLSLFAFFVLSCTTALLVRILISSGVVLIFPIFWFFGVPIYNNRMISLSYPWLGIPMEHFVEANISPMPFIISHVVKIFVYYLLYEASQLTFATWLYGEPYPGQKELWLYAIVMLLEYFSMIYVRSKESIYFFPRAILLLFCCYHFYLYSFPAGFHELALLIMFLFMSFTMAYTVRYLEVPAFHRGLVNIDAPRGYQNQVPWPMWSQALAPEVTLFQAVTHRSTGVYSDAPPPPAATQNNNDVGTREEDDNNNEDSSMNPLHNDSTNQNINNEEIVGQPRTSVLANWFGSGISGNNNGIGPRYRPVSQETNSSMQEYGTEMA